MNEPKLICTIFYRLNSQDQQEYSIEADFSPPDFGDVRQDIVQLFNITRERLDAMLGSSNRTIDRFFVRSTKGKIFADDYYPFK